MSDEQFAELMKRWIASMNRKRMVLSFKFYNKDHLGNIREVVSKTDSIEQVNDYYPFGTPIHDMSNKPELQPFKYNGKELDMMHGLNTLDYGARQYNSVLPLWDRVDPLAEDYYNVSPYVYCMNNPTNAIDPDGRKVYTTNLEAQRNIINTLNQEESKYVSFGTDGLLDSDLLNKYNGISENFEALCTLANSELNYIFSVSDQDINGNGFFEKGSNQSNPNNYFYGVTNIPGAESFPSPNNNIYIYRLFLR
jgi:RHS repeat-associated protein